ncbi:MAG: ComF family protein [Anaerolineae bacterium]|nr:ComF family protein [Anaerolineae bacterium]
MPSEKAPGRSMKEQAQHWMTPVLDLLFPPRCIVCKQPGADICSTCLQTFMPVPEPVCEVCSEPVSTPGLCDRCRQNRPAFFRVYSAYCYEGAVQQAVQALKYRRRKSLSKPLALSLAEQVPLPAAENALIAAVPMHVDRQTQRGYNHAALLAVELSKRWGIPLLSSHALRRTVNTKTQVGLKYTDRVENVKGAFYADSHEVTDHTILLIDDVCTTGATLDAIARILLTAGAEAVIGITLARTI